MAKVKQARVETIGTRIFGCCGHGSLVVFCRVLSCFFASTQHFAAMELGQSVSIAGKYAGKVVSVERPILRNVTVKSTALL